MISLTPLTIAILLFLFIGLLWLAITNFKAILYLFIFLTPLFAEPLSLYLSPVIPLITFSRVMLVILTLGWLIRYSLGINREIQKPPLFGLILLFTGLLFMSAIFSINLPVSFKEFFSERKIGIPIIYFLIFQTIKTEQEIKKVFYLFIAAMTLVSILGIIEFITGYNIFYQISALPDEKLKQIGFGYHHSRVGYSRIYSAFFSPIALAAYLVFILPIALSLFKSIPKRAYYRLIIAILISAVALFCTVSAGAWLVFILIISAVILRQKKQLFIILILIAGIALGVLYHTGILPSTSINWRLQLINPVIKTTLSHPLWGTGFNTYTDYVKFLDTDTNQWVSDPMSYFQVMLVENGIPALLVFLIFYFLFMLRLNNAIRNSQKTDNYFLRDSGFGLKWAFIGTFLLALGSVSIINCSSGPIVFWISVALAMRLWLISKSTKSV